MPFTTAQITEMFNIDKSQLTRWKQAGASVAYLSRNKWDGPRLLEWFLEQHLDRTTKPIDPGILEERRRLLRAKADREEQRRDVEAGELISGPETYRRLFNIARAVRDSCLGIADRTAPLVAVEGSQHGCREILLAEIRHVLMELKSAVEGFRQ